MSDEEDAEKWDGTLGETVITVSILNTSATLLLLLLLLPQLWPQMLLLFALFLFLFFKTYSTYYILCLFLPPLLTYIIPPYIM